MNTKSKSNAVESLKASKSNLSSPSENINANIIANHGTVKIGKQVFAIELHWELTSSLATARQEAKKRANEPHFSADFCCVRRSTTQQFALGFKNFGHQVKLPSLAASLADNIGGNWLGIFKINNGFYILGVEDDGILAETDRFFDDKQSAVKFFQYLQTLMEWDNIYAPPEAQIANAIELDIAKSLSKRPNVRLENVNSSGIQPRMLIGLFGLLLIVVGIVWYINTPHTHIDQFEEKLGQLTNNTLQQSGLNPKPIEPPPMPWVSHFQGVPVLIGCVNSINQFPVSIAGWSVAELICNENIASARLNRIGKLETTGGSINWIIPYLQKPNFEPNLVLPAEGSTDAVEVNWIPQQYPLIRTDLETASVDEIREAMLKIFEERMTPITFTQTDNNEFWQGVGFQFTSPLNPLDFVDILSLVPGLIISTVHYEPNFGNWTIKGKAYEQLTINNSKTH